MTRVEKATEKKLVLASASPRRKELLESVGLSFSVITTNIDESIKPEETPESYIVRLSVEKARAALNQLSSNDSSNHVILAADTIVSYQGRVFGKPKNRQAAMEIWQTLSGQVHQVMTSVCVLFDHALETRLCRTEVTFREISESAMRHYWRSAEPSDKAGAYAIQGLASAWIESIHGSYSNVVGLPLFEVNAMLRKAKLNWL